MKIEHVRAAADSRGLAGDPAPDGRIYFHHRGSERFAVIDCAQRHIEFSDTSLPVAESLVLQACLDPGDAVERVGRFLEFGMGALGAPRQQSHGDVGTSILSAPRTPGSIPGASNVVSLDDRRRQKWAAAAVNRQFDGLRQSLVEALRQPEAGAKDARIAAARSRCDLLNLLRTRGVAVDRMRTDTWRGQCPFCESQRFYVRLSRRMFRCERCHVGGDAFAFVMKMDGVSFDEALRTVEREC